MHYTDSESELSEECDGEQTTAPSHEGVDASKLKVQAVKLVEAVEASATQTIPVSAVLSNATCYNDSRTRPKPTIIKVSFSPQFKRFSITN